MSRVAIIDHAYRLQAADLGRQLIRVQITSVSLQGLEESRPMLHLAEFPNRPLVLEAEQRNALIRITGSALFSDWVGQTVRLRMVHNGKSVEIEALEVNAPLLPIQRPAAIRWPLRSINWRTLLLVIVILLVFAAVALLDNGLLNNSEALWAWFR